MRSDFHGMCRYFPVAYAFERRPSTISLSFASLAFTSFQFIVLILYPSVPINTAILPCLPASREALLRAISKNLFFNLKCLLDFFFQFRQSVRQRVNVFIDVFFKNLF